MSVVITTRKFGTIYIIDFSGRLTVGLGATGLCQAVTEVATAQGTDVILNLAEVEYMDSTGLQCLAVSKRTLDQIEGSLKLLNPSTAVTKLLQATYLSEAFPSFTDEESAILSCT